MVLPYRWLAACILLSIATTVRAYSTGVPAAACTRIYPEGHNGTSQNLQSSPYVLDISQFYNQLGNLYYTPGYSYKDLEDGHSNMVQDSSHQQQTIQAYQNAN
ncbi:hypothetical protein EMCRGX_G012409 [Ephydatia muelleri]